MKFCNLLLFIATCRGQVLQQYTPDKSDWSTFYDKSVVSNKNTDHSPDGVWWIGRDDWKEWDGTIFNATEYSKQELSALICPGNTVRGIRKIFYDKNPFADNVNPTKAEVDNWHAIAVNHVRAMVGYTGEEYTIKPDKCLHLRALWSTERHRTRMWDTDKYPGTCDGSTNPHCGAGFLPSEEDQQPYLPDGINYCGKRAGSEGLFSAAKSNIPWSIKWIRPFCSTLGTEGFWGGHTGPWFHRTEFGWDWRDSEPSNFNSNAGLRAKWSGPSGPVLYKNPDQVSGRFLVKAENVNPYPRFDNGVECSGIKWNGGADSATECYERTMEDENCGKRFMTFNVANFGCGCYPPDMAVCETERIASRHTWDFEPVVYSFKGVLVDITKALTANALPYNGRECPQIIWKIGAGDISHCLQKLMEGNYPDCGRRFITWNSADGGCACYPPDQKTCTRSESIRRSGRHTYELEVDPTYYTKAPTPPIPPTKAPTSTPTTAPTKAEEDTPEPSTVPSWKPTDLSGDCNDGAGNFVLKMKSNKKPALKTCDWLAKKNNKAKAKVCANSVDYSGISVPAQDLCQESCKSCDICYENPNSKFVHTVKKKSGKVVLKTCAWLASHKRKVKFCKKKKLVSGGYDRPSVTCPGTCAIGSC